MAAGSRIGRGTSPLMHVWMKRLENGSAARSSRYRVYLRLAMLSFKAWAAAARVFFLHQVGNIALTNPVQALT